MADPKPVASASASASVAVPPPPPPAPKKDEKKDEAPKPAAPEGEVKVPTVDLKTPRVELGVLGYGWVGMGNDAVSNVDPHKGWMQDFRLMWPRFNMTSNGQWWFAPSLNVTHNKVETGQINQKGPAITSSADLWTIGLGGDFFFDPFKYFGAFAGVKIGATHAGSKAPEDGESGSDGTFIGDGNKYSAGLKVSLDNWGLTYGLRAGIRLPEQKVTDWLGIGAMAYYQLDHTKYDVTPDWSDRNPNDPTIGVPSTRHAVVLGISGTFGGVSQYHPKPKDEKKAEPAPVPASPPAEEKKAAPALPKAVQDIQAMVDPMKKDVAAALANKYADNTAASLKIAKDSDQPVAARRDAAEMTVRTSKEATEAYKKSLEKVASADKALAELKKDSSIKPEEVKAAEDAVKAIHDESDKLKAEAHTAWENAGAAVKAFNEIKKLPKDVKKLDPFKDADPATLAPAPAAAAAAPKGDDKKVAKK